MAGRKADKVTMERRIETIYRLLLDGWTPSQILQNTTEWGLQERQRRHYIAIARKRFEEGSALSRAELLAEHIAARRQLRREAKGARDKLAVLKDEAELLGLYPPKSVMVTTWQDEVVDLLRKGKIAPADVRAAFPDLASEFFARAGVRVGVDD